MFPYISKKGFQQADCQSYKKGYHKVNLLRRDPEVFSAWGIKCKKRQHRKGAEAGCEIRGLILTDQILHEDNPALVNACTRIHIVDIDQGSLLVFKKLIKDF